MKQKSLDAVELVELKALARLASDPVVKRAFSKLGSELPKLPPPHPAHVGRPRVSGDDGPSAMLRARVGSARLEKFNALGGARWLRDQIDRAKLQKSPAPAAAQDQESAPPVAWRDQLFD